MKKIFSLVIIIISFFVNVPIFANEMPTDIMSYFTQIETIIQNPSSKDSGEISADIISEHKEKLRLIQKNAQEKVLTYQDEKEQQQQLLKTLGEAPDKEQGEAEADEVATVRQELNTKIIEIDGKIKNAQLNIAKSENLLGALNKLTQEQLQLKLTERLPSPFLPKALLQALEQSTLFFQEAFNNPLVIGIILLIILIKIALFPLVKFLNKRRQSFQRISFLEIDYRLVIQLMIASTIIMVLRYSDISGDKFSALISLSQAMAAIILSISLYELLGKVQFPNVSNPNLGGFVAPFWKSLLQKLRIAILLFIPLSVIGFTEFSAYFIFNIFTVLLAIIFFVVMRALAIESLLILEKIRNSTEVKSHKDIIASGSTIIIIEPLIALLTALFALFFWGYDYAEIQSWANQYTNGIPIGQFTLNFQDITAAIASFSVIFIFFKLIKWFLSSRVFPKTSLDIGIINTVLTILGYVGIVLAVFSAGAALGFDASNFALVAGALSVGIGFGLQAIFSNFVSGLILLFERPFKVGDWVKVNDFEGIIKKISVRSTEIETFNRSSVIVPNAQLISDVVTNRSLHNETTRIDLAVGVAYGSDIDKVKQILLDCANNHSEILNTPEPHVLFMNFGDSSLDFDLRFFIPSVHSSLRISSDVRFMIDKKFRQENIEIPFPQRDLHIRSGLVTPPTL